jgi:rhodanese-related sulfurtransferase
MSNDNNSLPFAGEVDAATAWTRLTEDRDAVLIDVRTTMEWETIGIPDLSELGKEARFVEWQLAPDMQVNERFLDEVAEAGVRPEQSLYLLCRSGARSANAAALLTAHGYARCYNVRDGFEGRPNLLGRRGTVEGWQWADLPWRKP